MAWLGVILIVLGIVATLVAAGIYERYVSAKVRDIILVFSWSSVVSGLLMITVSMP